MSNKDTEQTWYLNNYIKVVSGRSLEFSGTPIPPSGNKEYAVRISLEGLESWMDDPATTVPLRVRGEEEGADPEFQDVEEGILHPKSMNAVVLGLYRLRLQYR